MKELSLTEIKSLLLDMMIDIDAFCREKGIKYSLNYGSLLGAARHKGFIPWDDDIDLMMYRDDYERFLSEYHSEKYKVLSLNRDPDWCYPLFARITDIKTQMFFTGEKKSQHGLWIAIIVVDNMPHPNPHYQEWDKFRYSLKRWLDLIDLKIKMTSFNQSFAKNVLKGVLYPFFALIPAKKIAWLVEKRRCIYNKTNTTFCAEWLGGGRAYYFPRYFMNEYIDLDFEGHSFMSIKEYDCYLKIVYGDYMVMPPKEKQVPLHNYKAYFMD